MKRIVICCDGTWNRLDAAYPTNVVRLAESIGSQSPDGTKQIVWYDEGVGSGNTAVARSFDRWLGGGFGAGLMTKVEQAYRFLIFNYDPGDEIFIFGFSRGAYTARSLAGLIRNCGIVEQAQARRMHEAVVLYRGREKDSHPDSDKSCAFRYTTCPSIHLDDRDIEWRVANVPGYDASRSTRLQIRYLGVWDTVGALGLPNYFRLARFFNGRYRFHDEKLSRSVVAARHALAIDEYRRAFEPSVWENLDSLNDAAAADGRAAPFEQIWFPGDHGSVGGGGDIETLSSGGFLWIAEGATEAGLSFRESALAQARAMADHRGPLTNQSKTGGGIMRFLSRAARSGPTLPTQISESAYKRWHESADALPEKKLYRPAALARIAKSLGGPDAR